MAWLLHSLWMDAGAAIGFGEGLSGAALTPKRLSIGVLFVWLCSVVADAATGAYDSNRFDHHDTETANVAGIIGVCIEIGIFVVFTFSLVATRQPNKIYCAEQCIPRKPEIFCRTSKPWPLRIVVIISVLVGGCFVLLWNLGVPLLSVTSVLFSPDSHWDNSDGHNSTL